MKKIINTQFIKFAGIGILNTAIDFFILKLIMHFGDGSISWFMVSKAFAVTGATTNSFVMNRFWTFKTTKKIKEDISPFLIISALGMLINVSVGSLSYGFLIDHLVSNVATNISAVFAASASFLFNYFGYKYFVFKG